MMGTVFDDPNREAVGLEPAWVEGTGGTPGEVTPQPAADDADTSGAVDELDQMSKADLLEYAKQLGVSPANNDMTKEALKASIEEHQQSA